MAVSWLVFDGAKGQIRMISVLSTPARVRWVNQYLAASQSGSLRALLAVSQLELSRTGVDRHLRPFKRPPTPPRGAPDTFATKTAVLRTQPSASAVRAIGLPLGSVDVITDSA